LWKIKDTRSRKRVWHNWECNSDSWLVSVRFKPNQKLLLFPKSRTFTLST